MKKVTVLILSVIMALFMLVSNAYSGSLQKEWIPADSKWIIHIDLESLFKTRTWSTLYDRREKKMDVKINKLYDELKINLLKDIKSVTLFGNRDTEKDAVILARGRFDKKFILKKLGEEENFGIIKSGSNKLYRWDDDAYGAFLSDHMILFAHHDKALLDILGKKRGTFESSPLYATIKKMPRKTFMYAVFGDFSLFKKRHNGPYFLKNTKNIHLSASESSGILNLYLNIATENMEKAKNLMQVVNGIVALVKLSKSEEKLSEAAKFLDMLKMSVRGNSIVANLAIPVKELKNLPRKHLK